MSFIGSLGRVALGFARSGRQLAPCSDRRPAGKAAELQASGVRLPGTGWPAAGPPGERRWRPGSWWCRRWCRVSGRPGRSRVSHRLADPAGTGRGRDREADVDERLDGLHVLRDELLHAEASHDLDPLQVLVDVSELGVTGYQAADWLRENCRVDVGLSDHRRILATLVDGRRRRHRRPPPRGRIAPGRRRADPAGGQDCRPARPVELRGRTGPDPARRLLRPDPDRPGHRGRWPRLRRADHAVPAGHPRADPGRAHLGRADPAHRVRHRLNRSVPAVLHGSVGATHVIGIQPREALGAS
jgi:hypothetical protein